MRIVSGMRPTGKLHLGHYFGVIRNWVKLQEEHECFFFIADWHALTTAYKNTKELRQNIREVMIDWLALGLDPQKSVLFIQSLVKEHAELFLLFGMITPKSWLELNPTYKDLKYNLLRLTDLEKEFKEKLKERISEIVNLIPFNITKEEKFREHLLENLTQTMIEALFEGEIEPEILKRLNVSKRDFYETDTFGFLGYPVLQAADILIYKGEGVPVGEDQLPHIELSREIARRFNRLYGKIFPEPKALLTETPKIPGTDGRKMSKSYGNAVFFSDEKEEVEKKVMKMFTDPQKIRKNDPGRPEICPVFSWHKLFTKDEELVKKIEEDCRAGRLGCVECKRILLKHLEEFLEPIRERRRELEKRINEIEEVFYENSRKAREIAQKTMEEVRKAMNLP
ncbi:tryptophan--tRNA ligase [Aquifex aeolicus]|uniref:Tryptophan--tRNA ligase n=1 Tax=Aquifex aeolicus (strain VF5) TaxID=224324 RepID=SYW_AQUAE|nr:tryptophan--tRNA ligase [Aquifex aeolicus]O67115.1 RecName: Full=Tryptophan--tRNA ligase; AltName: Full=Tryptophanyl-tRNA synthetase; Short=TrpRS [Aquifex aeolicus VF5]AAC07073.1 tryptophanyl-tRNA synthetase [Aquifex aeolicus VF5]